MPLIKSFEDIIKKGNIVRPNSFTTPNLQSDYVVGIMPSYKENVNASDFDGLLITNLGSEYLNNGLGLEKTQWGVGYANMKFQNNLTFSFIGTGYSVSRGRNDSSVLGFNENNITTQTVREATLGQYPSLIHYYYQRQLTDNGTLRIKTAAWKLPAVYIFNLRTNSPIYVLIDCRFTLPTFSTSPTSNDMVAYQTTVCFNSFKDLQNFESYSYSEYESVVDKNDKEYNSLLSDITSGKV